MIGFFCILTCIALFIAVYVSSYASSSTETQLKLDFVPGWILKQIWQSGIIKEFSPFWTSEEHIEKWGIEEIKLSSQEERKLHLMIEQVLSAGFDYDEKRNEVIFEPLKDMFFVETYNEFMQLINNFGYFELDKNAWLPCRSPSEIKIKFSGPREYRDLENRVGMIVFVSFPESIFLKNDYRCSHGSRYVFIFKQIDNKWKIEKMSSVFKSPKWTEGGLIQSIIEDNENKK